MSCTAIAGCETKSKAYTHTHSVKQKGYRSLLLDESGCCCCCCCSRLLLSSSLVTQTYATDGRTHGHTMWWWLEEFSPVLPPSEFALCDTTRCWFAAASDDACMHGAVWIVGCTALLAGFSLQPHNTSSVFLVQYLFVCSCANE